MDLSLIVTGAMLLLRPLLQKAGAKAAETIGQKLAEKTVEKSFWVKVKRLFVVEDEKKSIQEIENKPAATEQEIDMIEEKISKEINTNPQFADEVKAILNITSVNEFMATQKLQSIQRLQRDIKELEIQSERAGIASAGDYINRIELQQGKLTYQIEELRAILKL